MELIDALRVVYDLAEGNVLTEEEADTEELKTERERQCQALDRVWDELTGNCWPAP